MLNQNQQEKHPSNEVKATETSPFSGVIDSGFVQRIADSHIKAPRAFLFSHYILSKIQRRLARTSAVSFRDFAPYTLETPTANRQLPSENALAQEKTSVVPLPASPLQSLLLRTPVRNTLEQFDLQTSGNDGSIAEEGKQRDDAELLFSQEPSRFLSVKQQEGIISRDFLQKKEEVFSQSKKSSALSLPGLTTGLSFASIYGQVKPPSESSQIEESSIPPLNLELTDIFQKPASSVPVSINDASFADTVAEKSKSEVAIAGNDTPSRIGNLPLSVFREVTPTGDELTHIQRQVEHPDTSAKAKGTDVQIEEKSIFRVPSESPQMDVSEILSSNIARSVSSVPVSINDASFADTVAEKSKSEVFTVGSDTPSRISGELTHIQRKVEQPDASAETKGTNIQLEEKGTLRTSMAQSIHSISYDATPLLARRHKRPVVQSLLGLKPTVFSGYIDLVLPSRQDKILAHQDKLAKGASAVRQIREVPIGIRNSEFGIRNSEFARAAKQSEAMLVTTDNINALRRSVLPLPERLAQPVGMMRERTKEILGGMQSTHAGNAMRIFRQHLDMPHVRIHNDASANFMAAKLNAEAFTMGRDIFFASGKLNLSTPRGVALLRHELTHVKQQEQQSDASNIGEIGAPQREALEKEALANERTILSFLSTKPQIRMDSSRTTHPQIDAHLIAGKTENFGDEPVDLTHIQRTLQIQYAMPQRVSTPLMAEEGRGIETTAPAETPAPPTPEPATPSMDINRIAEEVYEIIERRLRSEKERRGYF